MNKSVLIVGVTDRGDVYALDPRTREAYRLGHMIERSGELLEVAAIDSEERMRCYLATTVSN